MDKFIPETKYVAVEFDPFAGPVIERSAPTTEAQREVWVASQLSREASCAYIESVTLCLEGELDHGHLRSAITYLGQRHEGLRSTISANGLLMIIMEQLDIPQAYTDLSTLDPKERQARLEAIGEADMEQAFDLLKGPLFRTHLIRTAKGEHQLRLTGHHVILDGWSMGVVMGDISQAYTAYAAGQQPQLPPADRFSDFALAQIDFAASKDFGAVERYWLDLFKGSTPRLDLPSDRPRPLKKTFTSRRIDMELDPVLTQRLREMSTRAGSSLVTTLLTCFELLIYRLTGDSDLCIGLPAAGQNDFGMKELVGNCVNLLALRSTIDGEQRFIDHLKERRSSILDATDNQKYTFGTLVRRLNVPREPGRIPLCPVVFNIDMDIDSTVSFNGLQHHVISNPRKYENFELSLNVTGKESSLVLEWSYNTDLFNEETIRSWMDQLAALIEHVGTTPEASIHELTGKKTRAEAPMFPPAEWLGTFNDYPKVDIPTLFTQVADQYPDNVAVELGNEKLSYAELRVHVNILAAELAKRGLRHGEPVGVCMDRSIGTQTAMLAILSAGGCYVPFDLSYPEERVRYMLEDAQVKFMLTQTHLADQFPGCEDRIILLDNWGRSGELPFTDAPTPARIHDANSPAYIIYTSGSTGMPKGVVVPHRGVVRLVRDQNYVEFSSSLVILQISNLCFDGSVFEIWGALLNGAKLVVQPQQKPTLQEIVDNIIQHKVNTACFTSGLFNLMVDEHVEDLHGLKYLLAGGDALSVRHVKRALQVLGPGVVINGYGPTENTDYTTCHVINDEADLQIRVPIGRPISNTTVHILDAGMSPVPVGVTGELFTGGDGIAIGYWQRPELTASRFIDDPFSTAPGAKLYRTGDLARWRPDGTVDFLGRIDGQVKVRGFRVELGEIENAISAVSEVKDRVVITRNDVSGEKQLVAYLVPKHPDVENPEVLTTTVRNHLSKILPGYMVPLAFVVLPKLPLTGNGKVDRRALPAPVLDTSPRATYEAPAVEVERALAKIWSTLLRVDRIGRHDNFFDLGGHSLLGIQMLAAVRSAFNVELSLLSVFEAPTLSALAEVISGAAAPARAPILPVDRNGELEASFGQQRMWMSAQFGRDAYDMSQAIRITGELDANALARAIDALVARHEPLRTTLETTPAGQLIQRIHPAATHELTTETVASFDEALAWCQQKCQQPFNLVTGPLFEPSLCRINDRDHILLLRMHHIVGDEWSIDVLLRDLGSLYQGRTLTPLPFSYADFAAWQRNQFTDEVIKRELDYWRDQLAGAPALLELPTDRPRPPVFSGNGALFERRLPPDLWRRIEALGQRHQATPFMTLLAAFQVLLHRYAGATDISIGAPITNRDQPGSEDLVGFFINTLVLRTDLSGEPSFSDLLSRVRSVALGAFTHQDIPFERVVEELAPERNPAYTPLFQVSFAHQSKQASPEAPGLAFEQVDIASTTAKFDLTLFTSPTADGLACILEYNTDVFDAATIERMFEHFEILLEGIVDDPALSIDELPLLSAREGRMIAKWNGGYSPYPQGTMDELFETMSTQYPDHVAVELGKEKLSYSELRGHVNTLAAELAKQGLRQGEPVGVCMDRSIGTQTAMLAILRAGGCYVPFDLSYPSERVRYMLEDAQIKFMLTQAHLVEQLPRCEDRIILLDHLGRSDKLHFSTSPPPPREHDANSPAYIMYTSGSTGTPKGVVVPHRGVVRLVRDQNYMAYGPELTFLQMGNLCFDASTFEIWGALLNGARLVVQPQAKATLTEIINSLREKQVTSVLFPTGLFNLFVDEHLNELRGLKHILTGGDIMSPVHARKALKLLGPGVLVNAYGPTENSVIVTCHAVDHAEQLDQSVPIGKPIANTQAYILDQAMRPVAIGVTGDLYAGGDGVALGYWQRPELTAAQFLDDPFSKKPGAKLYRTGDRAAWRPDGTIDFLGRADGQVKVRGFRIELAEVETAIGLLAEVKDNVVVVRNDIPGEKQLVAYVVPHALDAANGDETAQEQFIGTLREHLRKTMPAYMAPTAFVIMDTLPLNASGKVAKHALPVPEQRAQPLAATHVAPRNPTEERLTILWGELLNTPDPGIHDNFFDLGGQSMIGIRLLARVEDAFSTRLPLNSLFQAPTIAQFAELLHADTQEDDDLKNLTLMQPMGDRPPFFCIHGDEANHYLPKYLGNNQPFYAYFHQGEDGSPIKYTSVESIAAHFIKEMKLVRPEGPYLLGGYSFGGIVAYEMAQQLTAAGQDVPLVAMFDTYAPSIYKDLARAERRLHDPLKHMVMRQLVKIEQARGQISSPKLRHFHIIDTYDKAIRNYRIKKYDGTVTMYKAEKSQGPDDMGWAGLASRLDIRMIPGDHYSLIKEPDVEMLAQHLTSDIDLALEKSAAEAL